MLDIYMLTLGGFCQLQNTGSPFDLNQQLGLCKNQIYVFSSLGKLKDQVLCVY